MYQRNFELSRNLEVLLPYLNKIRCNKCGSCCGNCTAREGKLCSIHPTKIGTTLAAEQRGKICNLSPVGLALCRGFMFIACPQVVQLLEKLGYSVETGHDEESLIPIFLSVSKELNSKI